MKRRVITVYSAAVVTLAGAITAFSASASEPGPQPGARRGDAGGSLKWTDCGTEELPEASVLHAEGAAGPLASPNGKKISIALSRIQHTAKKSQGPAAGQPRRPRRQRTDARRVRRRLAAEEGGGAVRRDRLRPARRGRERARARLQAGLLRPGAPRHRAAQREGRAGQHQARQGLRRRVRQEVRQAAAAHRHGERRRGHGRHPHGPRQQEDQLLRLLVRHVSRRRIRQVVPGPGAARGAGQRRRPRRASGTRTTSTRTSPSTPATRRSPPGSPSTTPTTGSAPTRRRSRRPGTRCATRCAKKPAGGKVGRRRAGGHLHPGRLLQRLLAGPGRGVRRVRQRQGRRSRWSRRTRRSARSTPEATTATPSTRPCSAGTPPGRATGTLGAATTRRCYKKAPFMTWNNAWYNAPCAFWPAEVPEGAGRLQRQAAAGAALPGHRRRGHSVRGRRRHAPASCADSSLVVEEGGGNHGISLSGNECLDKLPGRLPGDGQGAPRQGQRRRGRVCKALPDPEPLTPEKAKSAVPAPYGPSGSSDSGCRAAQPAPAPELRSA